MKDNEFVKVNRADLELLLNAAEYGSDLADVVNGTLMLAACHRIANQLEKESAYQRTMEALHAREVALDAREAALMAEQDQHAAKVRDMPPEVRAEYERILAEMMKEEES